MALTRNKKKPGSIVEVLAQEILSGRIAQNTEMTQTELADSLGVSRMPVREALLVLEYQGLLERLPNNHVRVATFSDDFWEEMFSLCAELEKRALEEGVMEEVDADRSTVAKGNVYPGMFEELSLELQLHKALCDGMTNLFLKKTLQSLLEIYVTFAVKQPEYDTQQGALLLQKAYQATKEREVLLKEYFAQLLLAVQKER